MANYRLARPAREDLSNILAYAASDSVDGAIALNERFEEMFTILARNPEVGRERPDIDADVRSLSTGSHVIVYRPTAEGTMIARVRDAATDLTDDLEGLN